MADHLASMRQGSKRDSIAEDRYAMAIAAAVGNPAAVVAAAAAIVLMLLPVNLSLCDCFCPCRCCCHRDAQVIVDCKTLWMCRYDHLLAMYITEGPKIRRLFLIFTIPAELPHCLLLRSTLMYQVTCHTDRPR